MIQTIHVSKMIFHTSTVFSAFILFLLIICAVKSFWISANKLISRLDALPNQERTKKRKISIIGSGAWGCAASKLIASNVISENSEFDPNILLWVYEEKIGYQNLSELINIIHENVKYFPGVKLPDNVIAENNLLRCTTEADILIFVCPHQYLYTILKTIRQNNVSIRHNVIVVSLIKGLYFKDNGPELLSEMIKKELNITNQNIAVLSGPTIANEIVNNKFTSATLACDDEKTTKILRGIFLSKNFQLDYSNDLKGVELFGALKNVIALAAGFCDGMEMGSNTKAMILSRGITEMVEFCKIFDDKFKVDLVLKSCGLGDLIATSFGGRNRLCGEEFIKRRLKLNSTHVDWLKIEEDMLKGQKLQGISTCDEVMNCINKFDSNANYNKFPLFRKIYSIAREGLDPILLFENPEI